MLILSPFTAVDSERLSRSNSFSENPLEKSAKLLAMETMLYKD